jgi:mono/diheme cytochrome c family protein
MRKLPIVGGPFLIPFCVVMASLSRGGSENDGLALVAAGLQDASKAVSVRDGVYSEAQSARGKLQYEKSCSSCHGRDLSGDSDFSPALAGEDFLARWEGRTVADLFATRAVMPQNAPGSIPPQAYADVIAYLLRANGLPAGKQDMPATADSLAGIFIQTK